MITITDLEGHAIYINPNSVSSIHRVLPGQAPIGAKSIVNVGGQTFAVRETMDEVKAKL